MHWKNSPLHLHRSFPRFTIVVQRSGFFMWVIMCLIHIFAVLQPFEVSHLFDCLFVFISGCLIRGQTVSTTIWTYNHIFLIEWNSWLNECLHEFFLFPHILCKKGIQSRLDQWIGPCRSRPAPTLKNEGHGRPFLSLTCPDPQIEGTWLWWELRVGLGWKKINFNQNTKYCLESHVFLVSTFLPILSSRLTHCLQILQILNSLMLPL